MGDGGAKTKVCGPRSKYGCKRTLPLDAFGKLARNKDGRKNICLECDKERQRDYRANPEKYKIQKARKGLKLCGARGQHGCGRELPRSSFKPDPANRDGLTGVCKECIYKAQREAYHANLEKSREYFRMRMRGYYEEDPDRILNRNKEWRAANPEKAQDSSRAALRKWRQRYPEKKRADVAKRRAARVERSVSWADIKAIAAFYAGCPDGHEVDHVIPLQSEAVSGLHVVSNLQYLPTAENRSKHNAYQPRIEVLRPDLYRAEAGDVAAEVDRIKLKQPTGEGG